MGGNWSFNRHVGKGTAVMRRCWVGTVSGREMQKMKRLETAVMNTYVKKREEHRLMFKSEGKYTQGDYFLCRSCNWKETGDCKVVSGDNLANQHRMEVFRMTLESEKRKRMTAETRKLS